MTFVTVFRVFEYGGALGTSDLKTHNSPTGNLPLVLARYWVLLLSSIRYELQIELLRQIRVPLAGDLRVADHAKKQNRDSRRHAQCWNWTALSHTQQYAHNQRIFGWTNCYTLQTSGALGRPDLQQFVDRQCAGTRLRALGAINTRACVTGDPHRTEQGDQSEEPSVRAKITAPEVLHENRSAYQP